MKYFESIKQNMLKDEETICTYGCKYNEAKRINCNEDDKYDIRNPFQRDVDKIIHAKSYTRYVSKTQVYTKSKNDNISTRMTHVQFVSRASRTIARALNLNEDLCEAISLGHDIGHVPYGHTGESILDDICKNKLGENFAHNIQSVRELMILEKNGKGLNLTLQVLDGIMCHNGELIQDKYMPVKKDVEKFLMEYESCTKNSANIQKLVPMTLEGCVVRISDIIGYIGKDIEDAIILKNITKKEIPFDIVNTLGSSNAQIMNTIILDVIENSYNKGYISMSKKVFDALEELKKFNYSHIYLKTVSKELYMIYKKRFNELYDIYLKALNTKNYNNDIYIIFLNKMSKKYLECTRNERIVIDFIATMTDNFFEEQYTKYCN